MQTAATRQELLKLKEKLKNAQRGHKLLKDKRDSLIQIFMKTFREAVFLRKEIDESYIGIKGRFMLSTTSIDHDYLKALADSSNVTIEMEKEIKSVTGVKVPELTVKTSGSIRTYSILETNHHLDHALTKLVKLLPRMMLLIEKEYKVRKLAEEIEKTRKRVNALEYVILPEIKENVSYIRAKLEEMALQNTVRLMKIKSQIVQETV